MWLPIYHILNFSIRNLTHWLTGEFFWFIGCFAVVRFSKKFSSQSSSSYSDFQTPIQALRACAASQHCAYAVWTRLNASWTHQPGSFFLRTNDVGLSVFCFPEKNDYFKFRVNFFAGNRSYLFTANHWLYAIWEMGWWRNNV